MSTGDQTEATQAVGTGGLVLRVVALVMLLAAATAVWTARRARRGR